MEPLPGPRAGWTPIGTPHLSWVCKCAQLSQFINEWHTESAACLGGSSLGSLWGSSCPFLLKIPDHAQRFGFFDTEYSTDLRLKSGKIGTPPHGCFAGHEVSRSNSLFLSIQLFLIPECISLECS